MDCNLDWKNIAGLFPISQQILGVYEIAKGLYETATIIEEAVVVAFKELRESYFPKKTSNDNWLPLGDVEITDTDRANAKGSPVPLFTDEERRNAVPTPEPKSTRNLTSNAFYCNANRPLMTEEEKRRPSIDITSHRFAPVNITREDKLKAIAYEPIFNLDDESSIEELINVPSTWERLKESTTKVGIGILYFTPVIGTIYSGIQLAKPRFMTYSHQINC